MERPMAQDYMGVGAQDTVGVGVWWGNACAVNWPSYL